MMGLEPLESHRLGEVRVDQGSSTSGGRRWYRVTESKELALAGFLAGQKGLPLMRTHRICGSSSLGARTSDCRCSPCAALTLSASPGHLRKGPERVDRRSTAVPSDGLLALYGGGRAHSALARRPYPLAAPRLRVHAIGLARNEEGALLVPDGLGPANEHALIWASSPERSAGF